MNEIMLDDDKNISQIDKSGMLAAIEKFPEQIKETCYESIAWNTISV